MRERELAREMVSVHACVCGRNNFLCGQIIVSLVVSASVVGMSVIGIFQISDVHHQIRFLV